MTAPAPTMYPGNRVREVAWQRRIALVDLARDLGVSYTTLWRYMSGQTPWPPARRALIVRLLGVPEAELFSVPEMSDN